MRPITKYVSLFTAAVAITAALPMSGAAAAVDAFLKLGGVKGEASGSARIGQEVVVQVESWSWGATNAGKFGAVGGMHRDDNVTSPGDAARVKKVDSIANKRTAGAGTGAAAGGVRVATGDVNGDGRADIITTLAKPLGRGSLTVKAAAGKCTLGTHYPTATLTTRTMRYELKEVFITSCAMSGSGGGGGGVPIESITFNYGKIVTKYATDADKMQWDLGKNKKL